MKAFLKSFLVTGGLLLAASTSVASAAAKSVRLVADVDQCQLPAGYLTVAPQQKTGFLGVLNTTGRQQKPKLQTRAPRAWVSIKDGGEVQSRSYMASALPNGFACWSQMAGWSTSTFEFQADAKSFFGRTKWAMGFKVLVAYGDFRSKNQRRSVHGSYIGFVTVIPSVYPADGSRKDLRAETRVLGVYNSGTDENPIGTVDLMVTYEAYGEKHTRLVQVDGKGSIQIINSDSP